MRQLQWDVAAVSRVSKSLPGWAPEQTGLTAGSLLPRHDTAYLSHVRVPIRCLRCAWPRCHFSARPAASHHNRGSGDPSFYPGSHAARGVGPAPPGQHQVPEARGRFCSSEAWGHDHSVLERSVLLDVLAALPPLHMRRHCSSPHSLPLSLGDLRPTGQQLPLPHPDVLGPAVSGGSTQGMGVLRDIHISLPLLTQLLPQRKPHPRPRG